MIEAARTKASNLWRMNQFYETYRGLPKLAPLVRELSWTHNLLIMSRSKRDEERELQAKLHEFYALAESQAGVDTRAAQLSRPKNVPQPKPKAPATARTRKAPNK